MMKKILLVCSIILLMILVYLNSGKILDKGLESTDSKKIEEEHSKNPEKQAKTSKEENATNPSPTHANSNDTPSGSFRPNIKIGFLSPDVYLNFPNSDLLKAYLEEEFDFNFDAVDCDFSFTHIRLNESSTFDTVDVIFADAALDWETVKRESRYTLNALYDAGYKLKNFDSYFVGKDKLFTQFYDSLKGLTKEKIYFYPALIGFDGNNSALTVSLKDDTKSKKEPVINMENFYKEEYYLTKRNGPASPYRFTQKGEYIISPAEPFVVDSWFKQTVYVTGDNKDVNLFLDMVFDSKRLQKQYLSKLKIHGNQIERLIPTFYVDKLKDLFDEVLLDNVTYDFDAIYRCNKVRITYLMKDFSVEFDFE